MTFAFPLPSAAPLVPGRLVQRYKRFLADVVLDGGETVTASCANTGAMLGLTSPGARVWLSVSDARSRKYRHTWELVEADAGCGPTLVGINTTHPNRIVEGAVRADAIPELAGYAALRREVRYGEASRIDLLLEDPAGQPGRRPPCYVEIKNVHLMREPGLAEFPDSVTTRGARHLDEMARMVDAGARAVMVYLVQRGDAQSFRLARDIDPAYGQAFDAARARGVEAIALRCKVTPEAITLDAPVGIAEGPAGGGQSASFAAEARSVPAATQRPRPSRPRNTKV